MSDGSKIQWTGATLNIVTGCTRVSEGCDHCYIPTTPPFRIAGRKFDQDGVGGTTGILLHPERLAKPLTWRTPRKVFVNSLADLFHDEVPDSLIAELWSVMARTPQHTYQILTKRPARMRSLLSRPSLRDNLSHLGRPWPLPNVHLGVSVENQRWADLRIPLLMLTPAAVRFLSCEPLLGPVDLRASMVPLGDQRGHGQSASFVHYGCCENLHGLNWVIVGGESGKGARAMDLEWARSIVDQCQSAGVPAFVKQMGSAWAKAAGAVDRRHGGDPAEWPENLRVREFPRAVSV
jgi:protein gp37